MTPHLMTFGEYQGRPAEDVPLQYMFFALSQEHIRFRRKADCVALLAELRRRVVTGGIEAELAVDEPPPKRWKAAKAKRPPRPADPFEELAEKAQRLEDNRLRRQAALLDELRRRENPGYDLV